MATDEKGKWINPNTLTDREKQDRYLESKGLLNYQTRGQNAAQVAQKYAQAGVRVQNNWFKQNYGADVPPPQYANVTEPKVQINLPQPQQAGGNVNQPQAATPTANNPMQYTQDPNTGMVIKQKYQTVWLNGDPALKAQQEAQAMQQNKPLFGTIDQAKSGQVNWGDVSVSDRKAALSDPNFYKNNEITQYSPAMQQEILNDPNFRWDQLPKWQKTFWEVSSNPKIMASPMALAGANVGKTFGPVGTALGAAAGYGFGVIGGQEYDPTKGITEQPTAAAAAMRLLNVLSEYTEQGAGYVGQLTDAAIAGAQGNEQAAQAAKDMIFDPTTRQATFEAGRLTYEYSDTGGRHLSNLFQLLSGEKDFAQGGQDFVIGAAGPVDKERVLGTNPITGEKIYVTDVQQVLMDARHEIRDEINAGGDPDEVVKKYLEKASIYAGAQLQDLVLQSALDPLEVLPKLETKAGARIAEATGNKVAAEAFRTSEAPVEAARKYKTLVQTGQAMTIDPNFKVDQMGMFSRWVAGINEKGQVKAGGLLPTQTGLLDPVPAKDKQGWIQNMAEQTPQSRAQTGANMFYENIRALLTTFEDPHEAGKYLQALSKNDMDTWAGLGTRFAESPEFYTVLPALKDFNASKLDAIVQAWDTSAPNRDMLTRIADVLGEQPASLLDDLANKGTPEQDFTRVVERLQKSSDPNAQALLKDVEAGRLSAASMKQMVDLFTGEGALAWHPGQWKAEMLDSLGGHFDEWVTKRLMLDKSPEAVSAFYRTTALLKQAQSILLLGGSPGYAITNGLSNMVHRAATGIYGYMTPKQIDGFMDRLGISPARMDEGVGIGGQVEQAAGTSRVQTEAQVKAMRGQGPLTAAKDALAKIARGMPMSKLSSWFEKMESRQAFAIPMKEFWSQSWRRGVGFSKMSPELANVIKGMGQDPNRIYAAIEAGMNQTEIEAILTGRQADVQARSLIHDAAQKTGLSATQAASMLEKIGVLDTLDTYLKGQTTKDGVQAAFARAYKTARDFIDIQRGEDLKAKAEAVKQRVGLEGAAAGLDVIQQTHGDFFDAWHEHYFDFGEVMANLKNMEDEAQRAKAVDLAYQRSDERFRGIFSMIDTNYKGVFDAWGLSGNPDALNVLAAFGNINQSMKGAYDFMLETRRNIRNKYSGDTKNPAFWDDMEAGNAAISKRFEEAFKQKHNAEVNMGKALANIYESLYGKAAGEAARLWWEDVTAFNDEIVKREKDFRAQQAEARAMGASAEDLEFKKQEYYSKDKQGLLHEADRINGEGIARLERVIKGKGGDGTASPEPTPAPPTPPTEGSVPVSEATPPTPDQQKVQVIAEAEAKRQRTQQDNIDEFNALMAAAEQRKAADAKEAQARESAVRLVGLEYGYDNTILQGKHKLIASLVKYGNILDLKGLSDPRLTLEYVRAVLEARKEVKATQANKAANQAMQNFNEAAQERKVWDVRQINEDTTLLRAIALHGGIDLSIAKDLTGEKKPKSAPGVFTRKGVNIDEMARMLADDGYPIDINNPDDTGGVRQAAELINRARAGDKIYPVGHDYSAQLDAAEQAYIDTFDFENVPEIDPALWQTEFMEVTARGDLLRMYELLGEYPATFDDATLAEYSRMADETAARVEAEARDLEIATHLTRAEESITAAETRATAATTRQILKEKFQAAFDLSDVEAQAYMELSDSVADWYAKMTGEDADAFYSRYYADVVKVGDGETVDGGRLEQQAFHGSPYKFNAERLVEYPDGTVGFIVGDVGKLPNVPDGAKLLQDFPNGRMRIDKMGTGEGQQAFGWGLYVGEDRAMIDNQYRKRLSGSGTQRWDYLYKGEKLDPGSPQYHAAGLVLNSSKSLSALRKDVAGWITEAQSKVGWEKEINGWQQTLDLLNEATSKKDFKEKRPTGQLYRVEIPDENYLLWDRPLTEEQALRIGTDIAKKYDLDLDYTIQEYKYYKSGAVIYKMLAEDLGSEKAASLYLKDLGINGIKFLDGSSRSAGEGSYNYVLFDDNAIQIMETYYQNVEGTRPNPKGAVTFGADGIKATIHAFEAKDFSTLIHENGHVFRRVLADVAERTGNPYIKADLATIEEWAGVKNGAWDRAAEEKFARGFEQYITDGRAPTPKLKAAFESFKGWMLSIYKSITGSAIDAKISDDVRRIFDRMLGAENLKVDIDNLLLQMNYDPKVYGLSPLGFPVLKVENIIDGDVDTFDALKAKAAAMKARMKSGEVQPNPTTTGIPTRQTNYAAMLPDGNEVTANFEETFANFNPSAPRDYIPERVSREGVRALSQWTREQLDAAQSQQQFNADRNGQTDMFGQGEDMPLFSGSTMGARAETYTPKVKETQTTMFDMRPEFGAKVKKNLEKIQASKQKADGGVQTLFQTAETRDVKTFSDYIQEKYGLKRFSLYENSSGIELDMIEVQKENRGKGDGSNAMRELIAYADEKGKRLLLSPAQKGDLDGTTSRGRLVEFYKRFGFVENKGRNKNFEFKDSMYREPQKIQTADPVDSPAFKNWFGDSKVVDENGRPLVVYHGTGADFTEFRTNGTTDLGSHFGTEEQAKLLGDNIMPVYLSISNPLRLDDLNRWNWETIVPELNKIGIETGEKPEYKYVSGVMGENYKDMTRRENERIMQTLKDNGYDGIVYKNSFEGDGDSYIVFDPTQVKSTANRGTFDPANPNILFQEADAPFGSYDEASGFHPQSEVMEQGWTRDVMPLMKAMEQGAMEQVDGGRWTVDGADPEGQTMLRQYMRQVQNEMATTKLATVRWGESQRDFALLNYNKRYGLDRVADSLVPYQFYTTRSAMTWAARILDKPALYANYARLRKQQDRYERDIPERLRGKIKINAPWLPEWMGGSLYIDPITNLFFPANLLRNFERKQQEQNYQQIETERILQEWAADGQYSQAQVAAAAQERSGTIYERAAAEAKIRRESETANPLDFFTSFFGPAWYATTPLNLAGIRVPGLSTGNKNDVNTLPLGNTARALDTVTQGTWAEPVGDIIGLIGKAEDWGRKKFNLPTRGEYGEYYTKRQIANLVVEGKISSEEAQIAMLEKTGPIWEEASQRVDMELAMRVPGASTIYAALHDGPVSGARAFLPSLFGAGLLPSGELEYRCMKQEWNEAWKRADAGDTTAVSEFFDEHPEYQAYLAKGKDDEALLRSFLIGQIWDGYMELGTTNQKQARAEMGELFQQAFLNKETRSYDTLDVDTLVQWARVMDGMIPKVEQTAPAMSQPAPQVPLYDPYVTDVTDQFFSERTKNFPDYYEVQAGYYALPKSERKAYLFKHPELKQYWDWKDNWYDAYPQYKPIFNGDAFDRVDTSTWPPMLEDYVRTYALTGQRMPQGASAALQNVWIMEGQPMEDYQTWLNSTVVPGMIYGGQ